MTIHFALVWVAMAALLLSTRVAVSEIPIARTVFEETWTQRRLDETANGVQKPRIRGAADHDEVSQRRRLEDNNADQGDGAQNTFGDMFYTSPSTWTALEWGIFAGMLTLFGICFCCWCIACVVPRCCGSKAPLLYYAAMAPNKQGLLA